MKCYRLIPEGQVLMPAIIGENYGKFIDNWRNGRW